MFAPTTAAWSAGMASTRRNMLALGRKMTLRHDLAGVLEACPRAGQDHGPDSRQTTPCG
jgi:hypothetical protein